MISARKAGEGDRKGIAVAVVVEFYRRFEFNGRHVELCKRRAELTAECQWLNSTLT